MDYVDIWPDLKQYHYWDNKRSFQMSCDQYDNWVMFVVIEGEFRYQIEAVEEIAGKGCVVVCPPFTPFHREIMTQTLTFHFIRFDWRLEKTRGDSVLLAFLEARAPHVIKPLEVDRLISTCRHLQHSSHGVEGISDFIANHYLCDLLILLYEDSKQKEFIQNAITTDPLMVQAKIRLEQQAYELLHIKDIAAALNISNVQLTRRFQASFQIKPSDYLTQLRMSKVKNLLTETNFTIDHIAGLCGYDNGFYLSRVFTRRTGETPSQYRLKNRI